MNISELKIENQTNLSTKNKKAQFLLDNILYFLLQHYEIYFKHTLIIYHPKICVTDQSCEPQKMMKYVFLWIESNHILFLELVNFRFLPIKKTPPPP